MSPDLHAQQEAFTAHIRDPERHPPPPGVDPRRMQVYRDLFFNNVSSLLAGNFPVIRRIHGDAWAALVRDFYRGHGCRTPLFPELPREFLRWLADSGGREPWLPELAHYEWIELALQISEARLDDVAHDRLDAPDTDAAAALLDGRPLLSPLAWPLAYTWPVHRIGPEFLPEAPPEAPTLLLLHRGGDGRVRFHAPSPLAWRLLQRLDEAPELTGRAQLDALAVEAGAAADAVFIEQGVAMLLRWHREGIVPGIRA
ncbi:DNA-binding domain-containing protein [Luteimonas arsenica]|uniref:HvfC family RiPP maturation protein n=1 Tax=Luteimonas arsenica TaxID=1586242 RepID=UPI001055D459|nr:putative DNA-binding domain-containing protein [Luteimonas arsenica]